MDFLDCKDGLFTKYSRIFDCSNPYFDEYPPGWNIQFLKFKQSYFNDLLRLRGYVLLNEVYESLGFEKVDEYENIGWLYKEKDPTWDNFVDFGLYMDINRNAINYDDRVIMLNFNHDGVIKY